ncbi:MAG: hypothetical protein JNK14_08720 [Chitinophagaceae bacterium]|nr:hypothetical protein [Chitinophagaceae bacterium]
MDTITNPVLTLFSDLFTRLNHLEKYHEIVIKGSLPIPNTLMINRITNEAYNYPNDEVLKAIDFSIGKINTLQGYGRRIVDGVGVEVEDAVHGYVQATIEEAEKEKDALYENICNELKFYSAKLLAIRETLIFGNELEKVNNTDSVKALLLKAKELPTEMLELDIRQFALFFQYLRDVHVLPKERHLPNYKLAIPLSLMTGFSPKTIANEEGFGDIYNIKSDANCHLDGTNKPFYNLNSVKRTLEKILALVDADIKEQSDK